MLGRSALLGAAGSLGTPLALHLDAGNTLSYPGSGTIWTDLSGNGKNATLVGGPSFDPLKGGSIYFNGSQSANVGSLGSRFNSFTVEIWLKSNDTGSNRNAMDCNWLIENGSSSNIGPRLEQGGSNLFWVAGSNGGNTQTITGSWSTSLYNQCVIVKLGSTFLVYFNGAFVTSNSYSLWPGSMLNVILGAGFNTSRYFIGNISIVKIYRIALSSTEILQSYDGLKGRYLPKIVVLDLDAGNSTSYPGTGSTWFDLSNGYNATLIGTGGPSYSSANGGSLVFSGSGQYGRVAYNSDFDLSLSDYSIEGWFNLSTFSTSQVLISKDTYGSSFDWNVNIVNSTTIQMMYNGSFSTVTATVPAMSINQWYYVAIASISGVVRIYLNSVLRQTQAVILTNNSQSFITLGCSSWNNPYLFVNGKISALRVQRKGLSGSEVSTNFDALRGRYGI